MREPKPNKLIPIHKRRYCMVNPAGKPQFLYDEELPSFYVPSCEEVWLRLPEYLAKKLGIRASMDGHAYAEGSSLRKAEEELVRLNKKVEDLMVPLVKSKVIHYSLDEEKLKFSYEVRILVEHVKPNDKSWWHMETPEENMISHDYGWDKPGNLIPWSPEAEEWFKRVKEQIDKLREFVFDALYVHKDDGLRYRIGSDDIQAMIRNNVSPLPMAITQGLLEAPKEEKL